MLLASACSAGTTIIFKGQLNLKTIYDLEDVKQLLAIHRALRSLMIQLISNTRLRLMQPVSRMFL